MSDDEYDKLAQRYAKNLEESMQKTMADTCAKIDGFKDLSTIEQEFVKRMALANAGAHFGGFNKKENPQ